MRTITTSQSLTYANALNARAAWVKVEVYSTITAAWVDLTNYLGYNWIRSVETNESLSSNIQTATVDVFAFAGGNAELTSSPFVSTGLFNFSSGYVAYGALLYPYKQIRISYAVTPMDVAPVSGDWMLKFRGRIHDVSVDKNSVQLVCNDEMGDLGDAFIENEIILGSDAGTITSESAMQTLLNKYGGSVKLWSVNGTGGAEFNAGDSPGWYPAKHKLQRSTVMDALRKYADQVGHDLRFKWQTNAADLKLVMENPDRDSPSVVQTFGMDDLYDFKASLGLKDIRNFCRVGYYTIGKAHLFESDSSATSITNYGRRFMEIGEEPTSHIDTSTEADALAVAIIKDVALPKLMVSATLPLFPNAELMDYYTFTGDEVISQTQSLGVIGITHKVDASGGKTTIQATGEPSSRKNWTAAQSTWTTKLTGSSNQKTMVSGTGNLLHNGDVGQWSNW